MRTAQLLSQGSVYLGISPEVGEGSLEEEGENEKGKPSEALLSTDRHHPANTFRGKEKCFGE